MRLVFCRLRAVLRNRPPSRGTSPRPGTFSTVWRSAWSSRPPRATIAPSSTSTWVSISRLLRISSLKASLTGPATEDTSWRRRRVTPLAVTCGVTSSWMPTLWRSMVRNGLLLASPSTSPVVIGTSWPTRILAFSLSRVRIDGVDSRLEPVSLLTALMIAPNSRSPDSPANPVRLPLMPSSDCSAALRAASPSALSSSLSRAPPSSGISWVSALGNWVVVNGTRLPSRPASASCTPRLRAATSEISTTIASTITCGRRWSSLRTTSSSMRWVSGSALITSALRPGARTMVARRPGVGAMVTACAAASASVGAVAPAGVAALPGSPASCCKTGSNCSALACCNSITCTSPTRSARLSRSRMVCTARATVAGSPRITTELLLSTGRIDTGAPPPLPPNRLATVPATSRAELLRRVTVSMLARLPSICASTSRRRRRLSA